LWPPNYETVFLRAATRNLRNVAMFNVDLNVATVLNLGSWCHQ